MIEAVVVDLGGVAARFRPERRLAALASISGVEDSVIHERLFQSGFDDRAELGAYSPDQVTGFVVGALEQRVSIPALIDAWALAFQPETEVLKHIAALRLRKVLFTNNGPMIDACLAGPLRDLAAVFGEVICSWHLRARKPDAAAFERAAERLRLEPDQLLLLDDTVDNVRAAQRCGWAAECVSGMTDLVSATSRYLQSRPYS
jgi:HAD superfamily hydrolase (TIGR01509 family)